MQILSILRLLVGVYLIASPPYAQASLAAYPVSFDEEGKAYIKHHFYLGKGKESLEFTRNECHYVFDLSVLTSKEAKKAHELKTEKKPSKGAAALHRDVSWLCGPVAPNAN